MVLATTAGRTLSAARTSSAPSSSDDLFDLRRNGAVSFDVQARLETVRNTTSNVEKRRHGKSGCGLDAYLVHPRCAKIGGNLQSMLLQRRGRKRAGQETCVQQCSEDRSRCMRDVCHTDQCISHFGFGVGWGDILQDQAGCARASFGLIKKQEWTAGSHHSIARGRGLPPSPQLSRCSRAPLLEGFSSSPGQMPRIVASCGGGWDYNMNC